MTAQESPTWGAAAHVPQPLPWAMPQKPVWHCAEIAQVAPSGRAPLGIWQAGGGFWPARMSEQAQPGTALVQACLPAVELPDEGRVMSSTQLDW